MTKLDIKDPRLTFASLTLEVNGKEIMIKSVSYGDGLERGTVDGNARMALGVTEGLYKAEDGEIELYEKEFREMLDAFGEDFYEKDFDISAAYASKGTGGKTVKDEVIGCYWKNRGASHQSGTDGLVYKIGYSASYVKFGGKNPMKNMPDGAK